MLRNPRGLAVLCATLLVLVAGCGDEDARGGGGAGSQGGGGAGGGAGGGGGGGPAGPGVLGAWQSIGPSGGDRFLVAVDPFEPTRIVVVGHGGVHRSDDRGGGWTAVHDAAMQGSFYALGFDPTTAGRLAVGSNLTGVFVSDDGGDSFVSRSNGLPGLGGSGLYVAVQSLVFGADGRLWASLYGGDGGSNEPIFVSTDQGKSWLPAPGLPAADVTQLVGAGDVLFAVSSAGGPYRREGTAWLSIAGDLPAAALAATYLAVDPKNGARLFLGTRRDGLYRSIDGGTSWTHQPLPLALPPAAPSPLVYFVAIDPVSPELVWASLYNGGSSTESPLFQPDPDQVAKCGPFTCAGLYRSKDGGDSWQQQLPALIGGFRMTIDASEAITDALGKRARWLYLTAGGSACVVRSDDGGLSACRRIEGIHALYANALGIVGDRLFVGAEEGIAFSDDVGAHWRRRQPAGSLVYTWDFAAAEDDPLALLWATGEPAWGAAAAKGVWRGYLEGCEEPEVMCLGDPTPPSCPRQNLLEGTGVWRLVRAPGKGLVYALTQEAGILAGSGSDTSWTDLSQGLAQSSVTALLLDAAGEPWLAATRACRGDYAPGKGGEPPCSWVPWPTEKGGVWYFEQGSWHPAAGLDRATLDLAYAPGGATVQAATAGGMYRSSDQGRSFVRSSEGLPSLAAAAVSRSVVADARSPGVFYAGCLDGVYRSTDDGGSWTPAGDGLTVRLTDRLLFWPGEPDRLLLATLGGSAFVAEIHR